MLNSCLKLSGIPYIVADGEAEVLCAKLCQSGRVYASLTEDTDIFPNGSTRSLIGFKISSPNYSRISFTNYFVQKWV